MDIFDDGNNLDQPDTRAQHTGKSIGTPRLKMVVVANQYIALVLVKPT